MTLSKEEVSAILKTLEDWPTDPLTVAWDDLTVNTDGPDVILKISGRLTNGARTAVSYRIGRDLARAAGMRMMEVGSDA